MVISVKSGCEVVIIGYISSDEDEVRIVISDYLFMHFGGGCYVSDIAAVEDLEALEVKILIIINLWLSFPILL